MRRLIEDSCYLSYKLNDDIPIKSLINDLEEALKGGYTTLHISTCDKCCFEVFIEREETDEEIKERLRKDYEYTEQKLLEAKKTVELYVDLLATKQEELAKYA